MLENHKDKAATKAARKAGEITNYESWVSNAGHIYLAGDDASRARELVWLKEKRICYLCGKLCHPWDGDLEHIRGGRKYARCWCYKRKLADGTVCTNLAWVHGMFSKEPCHRRKHNREVKWSHSPKS